MKPQSNYKTISTAFADIPHSHDLGVELQRALRIFNSEHGLLKEKTLKVEFYCIVVQYSTKIVLDLHETIGAG